ALVLASAPVLASTLKPASLHGGRRYVDRSRGGRSRGGPRRDPERRLGAALGAALGAHPAPFAIAAVFAFAAVALVAVGAASAAERSRPFAVVWADRALTVPSEKAELFIPLPRGSAARVRAGAPGYAGIVLADGAAGWVRREDLYFY
ncbi:MAG: hypothetical protein Q8M76_19005, partial [Spirochaetaceae bacterium]|nr:hypothetical protein [Spirochaetaceae bacterium]